MQQHATTRCPSCLLGIAIGFLTPAAPVQKPSEYDVSFDRALKLAHAQKYDEAIAAWTAHLKAYPKDEAGYTNRGSAKCNKGNIEGAVADFTRAIALNPKNALPYWGRGNARRLKGDVKGALDDCTRAIELDPKCAPAYNNRANAKLDQGDTEGAIADLTRAIELDPKAAEAYNGRGLAKRLKGDAEGAIADLNRAIEINSSLAGAYINRGMAKNTKGDAEGAVADFTRAIELDPKAAYSAYYYRGKARNAQGDAEGATADLNRAIELSPSRANLAYFYRGLAKSAKGDLEGAIADFTRTIEFDPKYTDAYYDRGIDFYLTGNWQKAWADFDIAGREERPKNYAWLYACVLQQRNGQGDAGRESLRGKLVRHKDDKPGDWFSKVTAFLLGELDEAAFLAAAGNASDEKARNGQECEAWYFTGMQRLTAGKKAEAIEAFHKSIATGERTFSEHQFSTAELKALEAH